MAFLKTEQDGHIAIITIDRPPANALSSDLLKELDDKLASLRTNDDVRVIVLKGEGRFFCAGADVKEFTRIESKKEALFLAREGQQILDKIEQYPKPVIASIHGVALGGGLELAMSCHIRIVSETAKLGLPETSLGIIPGFAGTQRLPRLVGPNKALEMILTAEPITGVEAVQCGLANQAYPEEELFTKTFELARKIAEKSPPTVSAVLHLINNLQSNSFTERVEKEAELFSDVFTRDDAKEGIKAFLEKRKPNFTGK